MWLPQTPYKLRELQYRGDKQLQRVAERGQHHLRADETSALVANSPLTPTGVLTALWTKTSHLIILIFSSKNSHWMKKKVSDDKGMSSVLHLSCNITTEECWLLGEPYLQKINQIKSLLFPKTFPHWSKNKAKHISHHGLILCALILLLVLSSILTLSSYNSFLSLTLCLMLAF